MISVDTNIIVRLLVGDDKKQAAYAKSLFKNNHIYITKTVLLETEWVLRYTYELTQAVIHHAFESLFGLPQVTLEDPACLIKTMQWYNEYQFDFADAMHLAASASTHEFATLDKALIKKAKKIPIKLLTI
jgi:predicted nucleic-acid-binding protein